MLNSLDMTSDDSEELRSANRLLSDEVKALSLKVEQLQHQLHGHNRHRFGSKSESLDQLNLTFSEDEAISEAAEDQVKPADKSKDPKPTRQHSRKPLPDHLDRHDEVLSPGDNCGRCGGHLKTLGEDVTEELEYVPGRFVVNRIVRPRKACTCCEAIVQSPLPSRPIERGRPGPGLLAHVLVSKYADHLPLYRQSQIYAREGVDLDRSTMSDWVGRATALLEPLADVIGRMVRQGAAIFADDTPVKMQAPGNKKTKTARVWTYVRDERSWVGQSPPCAWYQFTIDRKGEHPENHLSGFNGWVHADGYSGFNGVFGGNKASEMACMAHERRGANRQKSGLPFDKRRQNQSLTTWKNGCMHNCPRYRVSRHWPKQSAMLWVACQRRVHILEMASCSWTTTPPSERLSRWPLAGKIGCSRVLKAAAKPWLLPTPSSKPPSSIKLIRRLG
jgi:transposase